MTVSRKVWRRLIGKVFRQARRQLSRYSQGRSISAQCHASQRPVDLVWVAIHIERDAAAHVTGWSCAAHGTEPGRAFYVKHGGPYVRQGMDEMLDDGQPDWETRMVLAGCRNALERALLPGRRRKS